MADISDRDWQRAKAHLDEITDGYKGLVGRPGVNVTFAIGILSEIHDRFNRGERTRELYDKMLGVE